MKKLIYLLALCLCLNGAALAREVEPPEPVEDTAQVEDAAQVEPADAGKPATDETPAGPEAKDGASAAADPSTHAVSDDAANAGSVEAVEPEKKAATPPEATGNAVQQGEEPTPGSGETAQKDEKAGEDPAAENPPAASENPPADAGNPPVEPAADAAVEAPAENPDAQPAPTEDVAEARFEAASGTLEALLAQVSGKGTIYLRVSLEDRVYIEAAPLKKLSELVLEPDGDVFGGNFAAYVSADDPKATEKPAIVDLTTFAEAAPEATAALYFWVDEKGKYDPVEPAPEPSEAPAPVLAVAAEHYVADGWNVEKPVFTLSGIPEGQRYTYAAVVYDERIVPLSGNTYSPEAEGKYSVRFAMVDGIGDIVSASDAYPVWYDCTDPGQVIAVPDDKNDYGLYIRAKDSVSGVAGFSVDGGETWIDLSNDEEYVYMASQRTVLSPGAVQIKDAAGNIWRSSIEIILDALEPEPGGGGGGGGGGGSGEKKPAQSHASGDGEEGAEYERLTLELPEGPMTELTIDGEALPLRLTLEEAQSESAPVGQDQPFTATLCAWRPAPQGEDAHENVLADAQESAPNTLMLEAVPDADLGDAFTYAWRFNGEVYRMLANSGVKYVALKVGDDIAAFSTEGFIGGTKYTELKMLGVSTRKFDYTLTMRVNRDPAFVSTLSDFDFSADCDLSIRAEVENMAYELSSSTNSVMYFYDVYLGPADMLNVPFGTYIA